MASEVTNQLTSKLVEVIGQIQGAVAKTADFAMAQLPDVAQSYVAFGRAYDTVLVGVGLVVAFISACIFVSMAKKAKAASYSEEDAYVFGCFGSAVVFCISMLVSIINTKDLLLVWFAPKVWLIQELANLVHKHS